MAHDAEVTAIAFGLLFAIVIGACLVVAGLIAAAKRKSPYDQMGRTIYPADDLDNWETLSQWTRDNPEQAERYLHEAMSHRGKGAK